MTEWYETLDEDEWLKSDDLGESEAHTIHSALELKPGAMVLDIPCGAGRVAIHLARMGIKITGIDLRNTFLARARSRFSLDRLDGEFRCMDMRKIEFMGEFDGIYNWQGSFGYFSDAENLAFLVSLSRSLKADGRIIIDQPHWKHEIANLVPEYSIGDRTIRTEIDMNRNVRIQHRSVRGSAKDNITKLRLYTYDQMRGMFSKCGLKIAQALGDYHGGEYTSNSKRLVLVGKKVE